MYHVSAQGIDERMINVHYYYYYYILSLAFREALKKFTNSYVKPAC